MQLPFALTSLKKAELFQVVKKLDRQFNKQVLSAGDTASIWEIEKKILYWSYMHHKHLGSPLLINELRTKKNFALKKSDTVAQEQISNASIESFETDFRFIMSEALGEGGHREQLIQKISEVGNKKEEICISPLEVENVGLREVFGNLVSRGYARYYPENPEVIDHWEPDTSYGGSGVVQREREVYKVVPPTQLNCDGIFIAKEGLLMGELLNDLYKIKKISDKKRRLPKRLSIDYYYREKTGATNFLKIRLISWLIYQLLVITSYLAIFVVIWFIFMEIWNIGISIMNIFVQ